MNPNEFKHPPKRHSKHAVDGILPPNQPSGGSLNFRRTTSYRPKSEGSIGDFKRSEGFHASTQPLIATPSGTAVLESPLPKARRRRLFGRRKSRLKTGMPTGVSWKTKLKRGSLVFLSLIVLTGGFLGLKGYLKTRGIFKGGGEAPALQDNVDPSLLKGEGDGRVNILLMGKGGEGHTAPDLTDTIIVASLDPIHKEAALVSVPRDLYVKVPGNGSMKVNAVYATAKNSVLESTRFSKELEAKAEEKGLESLESTIEATLGIPIHYRVMVDFEGFKKAIDTVGGVDVKVEEALFEQMSIDGRPYTLNVKTGVQHMDGFRALAYSRSRMTSTRGDFDRSERQRSVIIALKEKVLTAGTYSNPIKISQLLDAFGDHVKTNLTIDEMMRLYTIGKDVTADKISSVGLADPPNNYVTTGNIGGLSVVIPRAGVGNYSEIQSYIRNTLKDAFMRDENASVTVLNGTTTPGLATKQAEELKAYGYNIATIGDAPTKNYSQTTLIDLRDGTKKYTKHYLEKRLGVIATTKLPDSTIIPGTADFIIILGSNDQ